ncbi:transposase [Leisingera sp. JC1]|uniref:transposase n=1 Tax=Leisingera sp. JC1 TaxID=1855282 RepID=UPI001C31144F|nr:transposase [Leisingera sp. JC1]
MPLRGAVHTITFIAEIGNARRFETPVKLVAYLGLVPSEYSTGKTSRSGGITRAGNARVRHKLIEGAWTYRYPARPGARKLYILRDTISRRSGHRLEGAIPADGQLPGASPERKEDNRHNDGHRSRYEGFHAGHRATHHASVLRKIHMRPVAGARSSEGEYSPSRTSVSL